MNSNATILDDRETVELLRDRPDLLAIADAVRATQSSAVATVGKPKRWLMAAAAAAVIFAAAGASTYILTSHHAAHGPIHPSSSTRIGGPGAGITFVDSAAAADALLPFKVVLPTNAPAPAQLTPPEYVGVYAPRSELDGYYDTPSDGAYDLIEQPTSETVADLQEQAKTWDAGAASIQVIDGVHVLVQSQDFPPTFHDTVGQHITVSWIRGDGATPVLTTLDGPWLSGQPFTVQQALSVATDMIGQGG